MHVTLYLCMKRKERERAVKKLEKYKLYEIFSKLNIKKKGGDEMTL